ncbi:enoyl-CoA hydratase-related protein [soil metagenome]
METAAAVLYERRGPLAVITLNRPDRLNALTTAMIAEVVVLARRAEQDPAVIAICITGAGRGFCAGVDADYLVKVTGTGISAPAPDPDHVPGVFIDLVKVSKPVIAAVNGPAAGAGFILAMLCDLRFVAAEAVMTTVFTKRGLIAEHGSAWFLPRLIGVSRALDLLWSSRRIASDEAYRLGVADRVVPVAGLLEAVEAYVADLAANVAPRALATIKAQVYRQLDMEMPAAARETDALTRASVIHPDAKEGAMSFVERRPPQFTPWTGTEG